MGKARTIAASELEKTIPSVLVTGGTDTNPETGEAASRARELAKLMVERYQIPGEKVFSIGTEGASHTAGNVENVVNYLQSHENSLVHHRIGILSPRFQYERAKMMFDANPYFKERGIEIDWVIVEEVLERRNSLYKKWADAVHATPEAKINQKMEKQGMEALTSGAYRPADLKKPKEK